ncbi:MAG: glycosyltransferase [Acidobacteriaceae bacterium]
MNENTVSDPKLSFLENPNIPKTFLAINAALAVVYFIVLAFWFPDSNRYLFWALIAGEVYHTWMALTFIQTVWNRGPVKRLFDKEFTPLVDVFITVAGEPVDVVEKTVVAAKNMDYPNFKIYLLNDGYVAHKDNWRDIIGLAKKHKVFSITRRKPGGAKAGNINNGLRKTGSPLVVVFDADHVPHPDFLKKTIGFFIDPKVGFVQSPQYYRNQDKNLVTAAAWDQQALFFGPILQGKDQMNSVTMCGTNMAISRKALMEVGGICETNIAEDFLTGLFLHERGWKSVYVPEVLAEGLAPEDLLSYSRQQFRWARGSLEVLFRHNPLFKRGLSWKQKLQYLSSASYFLSGAIVALNAVLPLVFFYFGIVPLEISTMFLAIIFLPYIFFTVYLLRTVSNESFSFRALSFGMANFFVHIRALFVSILGFKSAFQITAKRGVSGKFIGLAIPHLIYFALLAVGLAIGLKREGLSVSLITNFSWAMFNAAVFIPYINAAFIGVEAEGQELVGSKVRAINGTDTTPYAD